MNAIGEHTRVTHNACTSVLAGARATTDGSVMIARTEDNYYATAPKYLDVIASKVWNNEDFVSTNNGFTIKLCGVAAGYTATPDGNPVEGLYEEAGINTHGVAMSATESTYTRSQVLAYDPLVDDGIAEDAMVSVVLPFITTAREGVERLGSIIAEHGNAESNGVLFADVHEAWYMELLTGHHWVAQRLCDDHVAVCPNRITLDEVDLTSDDVLTSPGIVEFITHFHLNPDTDPRSTELSQIINVRHVFATYSEADIYYNSPRQWYGMRYLLSCAVELHDVAVDENPQDLDRPFSEKPGRHISVDDIASVLSSHYNKTKFDTLSSLGDEASRATYRAISLSKTQEGHILQMRPYAQEVLIGIHWVALGPTVFTPFLPVFGCVNRMHDAWKTAGKEPSYDSAYWTFRMLAVLAESKYRLTSSLMERYLNECNQRSYEFIARVDSECTALSGKELIDHVTELNIEFLDEMLQFCRTQIAKLLIACAEKSELAYEFDKNL